jgi:general secretion pathway protein A
MYTDWFKLDRLPFRLRPDPDFLYATGQTAHVLETLKAAVGRKPRLFLVQGESGVGKTTVLHALATSMADSRSIARVQLPNITARELLQTLEAQFGVQDERRADEPPSVARLNRHFAEQAGQGRPATLLVDDAHLLPAATLRQLLRLCRSQPLPFLVLTGDGTLEKRLGSAAANFVGLRLPRLDVADVRHYIRFRLKVAGSKTRTLFDDDCLAEVYRYTGGTPKLINILCDRGLSLAEAHSNATVTAGDIRDAAQALQWVEYRAPELPDAPEPSPDSGTVAQPALELEVRFRGEPVTQVMLREGIMIVGRAPESDIRLHSDLISRQHCRIVTRDGQSFVEDLGSTNGVIVNGKRLRVHRLAPADDIQIGEYHMTCRVAGDRSR